MTKRQHAEKAFTAAGWWTFEKLWDVVNKELDCSRLTGPQIGQIMDLCYHQHETGKISNNE